VELLSLRRKDLRDHWEELVGFLHRDAVLARKVRLARVFDEDDTVV
jgi:hypothetical protein